MKITRLDKNFNGLRWNGDGDAYTIYFDENGTAKIVNITIMKEVEITSDEYTKILSVINKARENGDV